MKAVLNLFWQICLMRQGPEYVPTQPWFVGSVVCANLLGVLALSLATGEQTPLMIATYVVVTLCVTASLIYLACYLREVPSRFLAAFTAICGCDLIITVLFAMLLPVSGMLGQVGAAFLPLCFMLWSVTVVGFILHRALDTHLAVGIATAIGISLLSVSAGQVVTAA
ncbi:MAG: hypothetical protein QF921_11625 [Pseudomonadales bacterium]|jgi:hypothetical protein|nr:hypothetical protein [Pseudomonadales bacterium]MDP6470737.1 hypothetical protein [Pseudomonadales bacterium]MDP6828311.1 hypothetical protein [Pseudomonadales bacterium]MDP6972139.1 hypothetical protein [Pseudomonadales bacterium]|tara:strand:- start:356 stop:856 length:501 start_codon:yes stop_codon:yes gene_type:complete